jgi:hypothetical protein
MFAPRSNGCHHCKHGVDGRTAIEVRRLLQINSLTEGERCPTLACKVCINQRWFIIAAWGTLAMDLDLSQEDGDALLAMEEAVQADPVDLPNVDGRAELELVSRDRPEEFAINFTATELS